MYENFINSFKNIMAESGYVKINIPSLPSPAPVDMWARESGAMAYFYITYNCESMQSNFASYENFMRQSIAEIADRVHARHTVAFSIFVGRLDAHAESLINTTAEFALVPRYDVYFGVDENSGIRHHPSAPTKMDKSLVKIQTALNPIAAARLSGTNMAKTVVKFPLFTYSIIAINVFMF
ncbi:MAG: hypothetical protein FWC67_01295, partial [Defluviitaleaceae bacterium]|nr:hypothetical protein [Defluviitaleaceae bacterium]